MQIIKMLYKRIKLSVLIFALICSFLQMANCAEHPDQQPEAQNSEYRRFVDSIPPGRLGEATVATMSLIFSSIFYGRDFLSDWIADSVPAPLSIPFRTTQLLCSAVTGVGVSVPCIYEPVVIRHTIERTYELLGRSALNTVIGAASLAWVWRGASFENTPFYLTFGFINFYAGIMGIFDALANLQVDNQYIRIRRMPDRRINLAYQLPILTIVGLWFALEALDAYYGPFLYRTR